LENTKNLPPSSETLALVRHTMDAGLSSEEMAMLMGWPLSAVEELQTQLNEAPKA
jgi:hypothetical protein